MHFGLVTAMTSPRSWEDIFRSHEVRFLAHEAWNGLLRESVEKDRFVASDKKKKVKKQSGEASTSEPVVPEVEKVSGLARKMGVQLVYWIMCLIATLASDKPSCVKGKLVFL